MGRANPIDAHVGARLRQRRSFLGLSQEKLARSLDLTFQQIQKYERGANRISAGRLYQLAAALDVPVGYFFAGLDQAKSDRASGSDAAAGEPAAADADEYTLREDAAGYDGDVLSSRETLDLVRAYYRIPSPKLRRRLVDLVRAIGIEAAEAPQIEPALAAPPGSVAVIRKRRRQG